MSYRMALAVIRRHVRVGDGLAETFKIICRNRGSHPVRDWAIYDLAQAKKLDHKCAKRLYNRHLARLETIFRVPLAD